MKNSAYSKMFLVVPSVYDKVLKCIDEKDRKTLEQLNIEKDENVSKPSEKYFENIASAELQENYPEVIHESSGESEFIDPIQSNLPEPTFGEASSIDPDEGMEQPISRDVLKSNPLKTDCAQPDVQDQFIPQVLPGYKRMRITKPKLIVPSLLKKPQQIQNLQQTELNIPEKVKTSYPTRVTPIKNVPRNFICNFCTKPFKSTYHLNRHINSVHKDLVAKSDPTQFEHKSPESIQTYPSKPVVPQPGTNPEQFQSWQEQNLPIQGKKRTSTEAKLKYTPRPTKIRSSDYDEWK